MTIFRSEEGLVGIFAIGVFAWILATLQRGLKLGRLPIGRFYVWRKERAGAFNLLLAFYAAAAVMMIVICLDLLLGIDFGDWL